MINFKSVKAHNFLVFKDLNLSLENQGLTLIEGINDSNDSFLSNASGKSTTMSTITYALYGKTVTNETADDVINNKENKNMSVILEFEKDGTDYRIERYRKDKKNKNKVRFFADEDEITGARASDTNGRILEVFGIDWATYVNCIAYGQGDDPIFTKATDKEKKQIIENLANIGIYESARKNTSDKLKESNNKIANFERDIERLNYEISQAHESAKREQSRYEADLEKNKQNKEKLEQAEKYVEGLKESSKKKYDKLNEDASFLTNEYKQAKQKLDGFVSSSNSITDEITGLKSEQSKLNYQKQSIQNELVKSVTDYKELGDKTTCPVCGQALDKEHKKKELANILSKISESKNALASVTSHLTKNTADLDEAQKKYDDYQATYQPLSNQVESLSQDISKLNYDKKDIVQRVKAEVAHVEELRSFNQQVTPPYSYQKELKKLNADIEDIKCSLSSEKKNSERLNILTNKVFSRNGVPSMVLDLVTPFLNEHANNYLSILSGSDLSVDISTQTKNADGSLSDKFDVRVSNATGANNYQGCSSGERKRIDIAIALAIQDLQQSHSNMKTNFAFYDECFEGLDEIGCQKVIEILKDKVKTVGNIFVITHNDALKPFFDNFIKVEKNSSGFSEVVG